MKNHKSIFVYKCSPIDYFAGVMTLGEALSLKSFEHEYFPLENRQIELIEFVQASKTAFARAGFYCGEKVVEGICFLPTLNRVNHPTFIFIAKHQQNGETFVSTESLDFVMSGEMIEEVFIFADNKLSTLGDTQ